MSERFNIFKHLLKSKATSYKQWALVALFLFIVVSGVYLLVSFILQSDWSLLRQIRPIHIVAVLILTALGTLFYTTQIYLLLQGSGFRASFSSIFLVLTTSLSVNYLTPVKVGVPLRVLLYRRYLGVPVATSTALVAIEAILNAGIPAVVSVVGIMHFFPTVLSPVPLIALFLLLGLFLTVMLWHPPALRRLAKRFPGKGLTRRVGQFMLNVQLGATSIPLSRLLGAATLSALNVIVQGLRLYVVMLVLGYNLSPIVLTYVIVISLTVGNLSMLPMGIGVRDASIVLLLAKLGVPYDGALSVAVIQRLFMPGWPLLLGLISANVLGVKEVLGQSVEVPAEEVNEPV